MRIFQLARLAAAAAVLVVAAGPAHAFGIGLQPTTVEIEVEPGDRQRQVVNLANVHTEKTIALTIGLADWSLDEQGQIELTPPGESDRSAAEWVRFSPAFVTLEPGEGAQIVVDMAAPTRLESAGDHRFALIASTVLPEERAGQAGVWKKYQIASLFYLTTNPATSEPALKDASLITLPNGSDALAFRFENAGNAHALLEGEITVKGEGGETETIAIGNLVILDAATRVFTAPLKSPLAANPMVEARIENTFSPQSPGKLDILETVTLPIETRRADAAPAIDTAVE